MVRPFLGPPPAVLASITISLQDFGNELVILYGREFDALAFGA
jgi:hypothetical protein